MTFVPMIIFSYTTKHLKYSDKVRFYYAIKGRDGKSGLIKEYDITQLGKTVFLVKLEYEAALIHFFTEWKCKHKILHAMINKEEL
ncbi:hypothetical protein HY486_01095 [Candidatus Woesearchaeota archaeon]|nr:hypothetical protein [Candidatus Woesearchaeota archaeon]